MKHYLGLHPDLAKRGIGKLEHWYAAANQARENKTWRRAARAACGVHFQAPCSPYVLTRRQL